MNAQIFGETDDVDIYLHERPKKGEEQGKPIFKDLADTYDTVNDGKLQGIKALHTKLASYAEKLASHLDFKELGKNKTERQAKLEISSKVKRFFAFDKNLNTFFVGMDSDYFIHKDLDKFLKTEQRRYIQNIILGDLDTLLNLNPENPAFAIATAFRNVTNEVIALLVAVETFQKQLFLMKKKIVSTDYLISVGKIAEATKTDSEQREAFFSQIIENGAQLDDWRDTFGIDIREQLPLLDGVYPTLPLDTRYFDDAFVDKLLALFDDLESQIDSVLLNSENFQALNLLQEKYYGKIKCVYIDPPYNTGSDDFVYKDSFRHSSWLSLMYDRLILSKEIAQHNSVIAISINEEELFKNIKNAEKEGNKAKAERINPEALIRRELGRLLEPGHRHIYKPLILPQEDVESMYRDLKVLPDRLNRGEKKFVEDLTKYIKETYYQNERYEFYLMRNVQKIGIYLESDAGSYYPDFVLWVLDKEQEMTHILFVDPKGEREIIGGTRGDYKNHPKVKIAQKSEDQTLTTLEKQLEAEHDQKFQLNSFLVLRDSSELGDGEDVDWIKEHMLAYNILRLDWHDKKENGSMSQLFDKAQSYLDLIFEKVGIQQ